MKIALISLGRNAMGPLYGLHIARALEPLAEVLSVISRQAYNLSDWRTSGLRLLETDTYSSMREFVLRTLDIRTLARLRANIRAFAPDVLYYPMLHYWSPLINALLRGVPRVATIHDPVLHEGEQSLVVDLLQRIALRQASRAIVLSRQFVDVLAARGFAPERVDVIPLGEFTHFAALKGDITAPANQPPTLLFFGRIVAYKGLETLLRAMPLIRGQVPTAQLVVLGSGDLRDCQPLIDSQPGIQVVNRWLPDDQLAPYFAAADAVVLPYRGATQSSVIPVAYGFKKPVVASRVGGLVEQVEEGRTGFLVEPSDPKQLAQACIDLLNDRAAARRMGLAGFEMALDRWSWGAIGRQVLTSCRIAAGLAA